MFPILSAEREEIQAFIEANPPVEEVRQERRRTVVANSGERVVQGARGVATGVSKVGSGRAKNREALPHRDVSGRSGYIYRQWSNGDVAILEGVLPDGWNYAEPGPRDAVWDAITAEIGPYLE